MRKLLLPLLGASALGVAAIGAGPAAAQSTSAGELARSAPGVEYSQYRYRHGGGRYYGRRYAGRGYYGRSYGYPRYGYRRSYNPGAAAAAGAIGLATGAIIGGAIANQNAAPPPPAGIRQSDYISYCSQRYRSFDPASGTFLGYDGQRHYCQYP